ncbi:hypothetical protein BC793_12216 [Actinoplanes xinjiangensis]|uniref:Uncharacterized protein n=2 Tax=Actinoplanes xinjiangensis TaxID=512350 RepID=A0A316F5R8_9ACTN|nr:hypothetical protein BC793_12216 [Actinoplanes xinjiangensis]GIF42693.1 hypothetical protein Axi01nite_70040 [Actinoplanes xinjiangensis]
MNDPEDMTKPTPLPGQRGGRLLTVVSALSAGVLGWLIAHACTDWLLAHAGHHHGNPGAHGHLHLSAAILLTACLAAGSVLAVFMAAMAGRVRAGPRRHRPMSSVAHRSSLLSTTAFVAAEFGEHAAAGAHDVPPAGVLLLGCAVHALISAACALVWRHCLEQVLGLAARIRRTASYRNAHKPPAVVRRPVALRRTWQALAMAGRAPPTASARG